MAFRINNFLYLALFLLSSLSAKSQDEKKFGISYQYYFLNNSDYNMRNINFDYLNDYSTKTNHNADFNFYKKRDKLNLFFGIAYQYLYGSTAPKLDSVRLYGGFSYNVYFLVKSHKMNMLGFNFGMGKKMVKNLSIGFNGILGWSLIKKLYDYAPDNSYPFDEKVLSQGPFFAISFITKYKIFQTNKIESLLKLSLNERFIESESNFTIGLGVEFNFLNSKNKVN